MIANPKPKTSWFTILLIIAAVGIWGYNRLQSPAQSSRKSPSSAESKKPDATPSTKKSESAGPYEIYRNCTLAEARNNDGDSFMVNLPHGKKAEFRLYFVDTPESAFKSYAGGDTNHQRIRQQAAEMGGITPEQAVEIGKKGKSFTLGLLASKPFDIYTRWDSPYDDNRFHAFVEVQQDGKPRWLEELLVEKGLARIKTKPADLPDGTPASKQLQHLKDLERNAKRNAVGVWGF
jgi:endonuclease YncB( thermonuclease family)